LPGTVVPAPCDCRRALSRYSDPTSLIEPHLDQESGATLSDEGPIDDSILVPAVLPVTVVEAEDAADVVDLLHETGE